MTTEKRDKILNTALRLFVEHGFRGTSTSMIAKEADVATGTLFHHFKTKEELIRDLYLGVKFELAEYLEDQLSPGSGSHEQMKTLWFALVEWAIKHEDQYRFFKHCEATPYISEDIRKEGEARFVFMLDLFADIASKGKDKSISQELLFDLYIGMLTGFISHLMKNRKARKDKGLWGKAFDFSWEAIS